MKLTIVGGLLTLGGAMLTSCSDVCGCEPTPYSATISGNVTDATGAPVADAVVSAFSDVGPGCHPSANVFANPSTSAPDGRFLLTLSQGIQQDSVCLFVYAQPNDGIGGLDGSDTVLVVLDLRRDPPLDAATVDFTLPAE